MKKPPFRVLLAISALMFTSACTEDYFNFDEIKTDDWRPELALPLVNSSLSIEDIILKENQNGVVQKDPNSGVLQVVYDGRVFTTQGADIINLPTQDFERTYNSPTPLPSTGGPPITRTEKHNITFNNNGTELEIDSMLMKAGDLVLTIENTFEHDVTIVAKYPTIIDPNGNSLEVTYDLNQAAGGIVSRSEVTDLKGYTIDMTNGGTTFNQIPVNFDITFNLISGNSSTANDGLRFVLRMRNLEFKRFIGYVGDIDLDLDSNTINIGLFKNFKNGTFFLSNPFMEVTVSNSFGMPSILNFQNLLAYNPNNTPNTINIDLSTCNCHPINLNSPVKDGIAKTTFELDNANSNIDDVVSFLVKEIAYKATADLNPNGKTANRNFVTDTSKIGLDVFLKLPFEGYASGFTLNDTIELGFDNTDDLENGTLRINTTNGFPLTTRFQVIFTDENYKAIDSLFTNDPSTPDDDLFEIPASNTDAQGKTVSNSVSNLDVAVSTQRLQDISNGKYAIIKAELNTKNAPNQTIQFLDSYRLSIFIGLKAGILIK